MVPLNKKNNQWRPTYQISCRLCTAIRLLMLQAKINIISPEKMPHRVEYLLLGYGKPNILYLHFEWRNIYSKRFVFMDFGVKKEICLFIRKNGQFIFIFPSNENLLMHLSQKIGYLYSGNLPTINHTFLIVFFISRLKISC